MDNKIEYEKGKFGLRAVIKTEWNESYVKLLLDKNIKELELNTGKGWKSRNLSFLIFFPDLEAFKIIDFPIKSIDEIHYLKKLKSISISTYCKTKIDFNQFPLLEDCFIEWRKGCDSLFERENLKTLGINNYKEESSSLFSKLMNLENLTLLNSSIKDMNGIFELKFLNYLRIGNLRNIISINGIEKLQNLEILEIQKCKNIYSISNVFELKKLKKFLLLDSGNIKTINGIEKLAELEWFIFYESTNIEDGDLAQLLELKKLSKIAFQNRKHYNLKREDFG